MSQFDVAVGITQQAINSAIKVLFDHEQVRSEILNVQTTQTVDDLGNVNLSASVNQLPYLDLTPPSADEWEKSVKAAGETMPSVNGFKLSFSSVTGTMVYDGTTTPATGPVALLGRLATNNEGNTYLKVIAVLIDEKDFSELDAIIVNELLVPILLDIANNLLAAVAIPAIPTVEKVSFQPIVARIVNGSLVLAVSLEGNPDTNIDYYTSPREATTGVYTEIGTALPNALIKNLVNDQTFDASDQSGSDEWSAQYRAWVKVQTLSLGLSDSQISAKFKPADLGASASVSGLGVGISKSLLCPVAAAIDAMVDTDNWDKINASFKITMEPEEISAVVTAEIKKKEKEKKKLCLSVDSVDMFSIMSIPRWSDVIGSTMSLAASFIVDALPDVINALIVNKIVKGVVNDMEVYTLPEISHKIAGLTVSLALPNNAIKVSADKRIVQEFEIKIA